MLQIVLQWFNEHPEYLTNPFYVAGDSFSGLTVPIITQMILDGKI